jgi:hypothetical protein
MGLTQPGELRAIGIRVSPKRVYYAIVTCTDELCELLTVSSLLVPPALQPPDQLRFVRTTLLDIMDEYTVARAGIRISEYTAQKISIERINIEGVVQELLSSSGVDAYFAGRIANIAALVREPDRARIKRYFDGEQFMSVTRWDSLVSEAREAIVTGVAALGLPAGR